MGKVKIIRMAQGKNTTLSHLYIKDIFRCYLLEDSIRDKKIHGSTCIPEGNYHLKLNPNAGMNGKYKKRYPGLHKGMVEIGGIPNFSLVFIHIGNTHIETLGCPLTGRSFDFSNGDYKVTQSAVSYESLYPELLNLIDQESNKIEIINRLTL